MEELIRRLDSRLAALRPDFHAKLRPGLSDAEWLIFESRLGVTMPTDFRAFYQWRDGHADEFDSFRGNQYWMCSQEVAERKELLDSMIDSDFEPGYWEPAWVPFLSNGGGSHLCVDVVGRDGHPPGSLVEFWKRDRDRPVIAPSLEAWLAGFVVSLERDRWEKTSVGFECVERREEQDELDRRMEELDNNPSMGLTWDEMKARRQNRRK